SDGQLWQNYRDTRDSAEISYALFRPSESETTDPSIKISDDKIRAYYDSHKKEFDRPGFAAVTYAEILGPITAAASLATRNRLLGRRARSPAGGKSEDIAKARSQDSVPAADGGTLATGPLARFGAPFEDAAKALKPGESSQPV